MSSRANTASKEKENNANTIRDSRGYAGVKNLIRFTYEKREKTLGKVSA